MTTEKDYILDRLAKGDVPVTCFAGDFSIEATLKGRCIQSIYRYHKNSEQYEDAQGKLWDYAIPVQVTPLKLDGVQS